MTKRDAAKGVREINKWAAAQPSLTVIRDFLEWCAEQKIELGKPNEGGRWALVPLVEDREAMLARYLEIDTVALENERRALLESCK